MKCPSNLFEKIPADLAAEQIDTLLSRPNVRIERIVSQGQASPEGFWYDQDQSEWMVLLRGSAAIRFEGQDKPVTLGEGDYLTIAAHARHRVEWTDPNRQTVWLAVHFD